MTTVTDVWMETPDVLAFRCDDAPMLRGDIVDLDEPDPGNYGTYYERFNPNTGLTEWATPSGINKMKLKFNDQPSPSFVDRLGLRDPANYTLTGDTGLEVDAVYYRDEGIDHGQSNVGGINILIRMRHITYLKLNRAPTPDVEITVSNSSGAVDDFDFTFNDKTTRAGGIKVNMNGHRKTDAWKKAWLCSRLPAAPNHGVVDFANDYGITEAYILDAAGAVVSGPYPVTLRKAWDDPETGDFYANVDTVANYGREGIDVADLADTFPIQGIELTSPIRIRSDGHGLLTGDKVRFFGVSGTTQLEFYNTASHTHLGFVVTEDDADHFFINRNGTGMTAWSATPMFSEALGGKSNLICRCFTTNRAGTDVFEIDFGAFEPPSGEYRIQIEGYGVSDPFRIDESRWAYSAGYQHRGIYSLRLGCDVNNPPYFRPASLIDGVNANIYHSNLISSFCSEGGSAITPDENWNGTGTEGIVVPAGMGAMVGIGVGGDFSSMTRSGTTITAVTSSPHGYPIGTQQRIEVILALPAGYNNTGAQIATIVDATTITYASATGADPGVNTTLGRWRTGWVDTSRRATGSRGVLQDAGDNDDPLADHIGAIGDLATTLSLLSQNARFTPFEVQLSTEVLDPDTYAGTDGWPPLMHELLWYLDGYRVMQNLDGSVPGGTEMPSFSSMIAPGADLLHESRGASTCGPDPVNITAYWWAPDHYSTMGYAAAAAMCAWLCYDYGNDTLGDLYYDSAEAAYNWANSILTDEATREAYYSGTLDLQAKMHWTTNQYNHAMATLNGRCLTEKQRATAAFLRIDGGGSPWEDFWLHYFGTAATVGSGGSDYAVGDTITLSGGLTPTVVAVKTVSGGAVTSVGVVQRGEFTSAPSNPMSQASTNGSGTGATVNLTTNLTYADNVRAVGNNLFSGALNYIHAAGVNTTAKNYILGQSFQTTFVDFSENEACFEKAHSPTASSTTSSALGGSMASLQMHMIQKLQNGIGTTTRTSRHLKLIQAHFAFAQGANLVGQSYTKNNEVPRDHDVFLHEDSVKMNIDYPQGTTPFGHNAFASGILFFNFHYASGANTDAGLNGLGDNVTGNWEALVQKGSTKMWNPWKAASSYFEWVPQNRYIVFHNEFFQASLVYMMCQQLWLNGWDDNTVIASPISRIRRQVTLAP